MNRPDQTNTANSANAEFKVAGCTVKPAENTLLCHGETIHLETKTMAPLQLFAKHVGEVLARDEIVFTPPCIPIASLSMCNPVSGSKSITELY